MSDRRYLKPPWMQRHVGNRLSVLFQPSLISKLSVRGRISGRWHTTPVAVLDHDGSRYLVSYRGASDWARNLQSSPTGRLTQRGRTEEITVAEVPVAERADLLEAYRARYAGLPTVGGVLRALPDPADHPIFQITGSHIADPSRRGEPG
jgi:deazaflavin-dependent oxidoreductase (nitroreductase family)